MDIRMKFGTYNGKVRDMDPVSARAMLDNGQAELPGAERDRAIAEVPTIPPHLAPEQAWVPLSPAAETPRKKNKRGVL